MCFRLCGAGFNFLAAACVGGPPPLLPGVRWPLAGVWRAGVAPSGVCGGLTWLDPRLASLALVFWCAVVRRAATCRVSPVLRRGDLRCVAVRPAGPRRVAPCRPVVCRSVPRRVALCCGMLCFGVLFRGALHCGALRCGLPCCLVLCCGGSVEVSLAHVVVRSVGRSVAGWWLGGAVRCWWLAGSVLWGSACAARAVGSGRCLLGCPPWGPVPWSRVLWGSRSLALGAVAVPLSCSGACEVALVVARVVAWR